MVGTGRADEIRVLTFAGAVARSEDTGAIAISLRYC